MMKITKYVFALFIFCTLFTSCINDSTSEEDALYTIQDDQATDEDDTPINEEEGDLR